VFITFAFITFNAWSPYSNDPFILTIFYFKSFCELKKEQWLRFSEKTLLVAPVELVFDEI